MNFSEILVKITVDFVLLHYVEMVRSILEKPVMMVNIVVMVPHVAL